MIAKESMWRRILTQKCIAPNTVINFQIKMFQIKLGGKGKASRIFQINGKL